MLFGNIGSRDEKMAQQVFIWGLDLLNHTDTSSGDDEKVDRSLGWNIFEGNTLVVLVEELCWDRTIQNLVKYRSRGLGDICAAQEPGAWIWQEGLKMDIIGLR